MTAAIFDGRSGAVDEAKQRADQPLARHELEPHAGRADQMVGVPLTKVRPGVLRDLGDLRHGGHRASANRGDRAKCRAKAPTEEHVRAEPREGATDHLCIDVGETIREAHLVFSHFPRRAGTLEHLAEHAADERRPAPELPREMRDPLARGVQRFCVHPALSLGDGGTTRIEHVGLPLLDREFELHRPPELGLDRHGEDGESVHPRRRGVSIFEAERRRCAVEEIVTKRTHGGAPARKVDDDRIGRTPEAARRDRAVHVGVDLPLNDDGPRDARTRAAPATILATNGILGRPDHLKDGCDQRFLVLRIDVAHGGEYAGIGMLRVRVCERRPDHDLALRAAQECVELASCRAGEHGPHAVDGLAAGGRRQRMRSTSSVVKTTPSGTGAPSRARRPST